MAGIAGAGNLLWRRNGNPGLAQRIAHGMGDGDGFGRVAMDAQRAGRGRNNGAVGGDDLAKPRQP